MDADEHSNWKLNPVIFRNISRVFGPFTIDLFADQHNKQLKRFCAKSPPNKLRPSETFVGNAFDIQWSEESAYANPPFSEISRVLEKASRDKAKLTLIAPV